MRLFCGAFLRLFIYGFWVMSVLLSSLTYASDDLFSIPDIVAPTIIHEPVGHSVIEGDVLEISATITDNVGVRKAVLFFRQIGRQQYSRLEMDNVMGTDLYMARPPVILPPGIEYYIQASDFGGNSLSRGRTFSPLVVTAVFAVPVPVVNASPPPLAKVDNGINKWVWITLGVLAVGALAVSGSDDGRDGGAPTSTGGSIVISGPGISVQ